MTGGTDYRDGRELPSLAGGVPEMTAPTRPASGTPVSWTGWSDKQKASVRLRGTIRHVGRGNDPIVRLELDAASAAQVSNADTYSQRLSTLTVEVPPPADLEGLAAAILALADTRGQLGDPQAALSAARQARALTDQAKTLLLAYGYEAIYAATRALPQRAVAHELGEKVTTVHHAVTEHRKSLRGQP